MFDDLPTNLGQQIHLTVAKEIQVYLAGRYEIIKIVHFSELFPTLINVGNCRTACNFATFVLPDINLFRRTIKDMPHYSCDRMSQGDEDEEETKGSPRAADLTAVIKSSVIRLLKT